MTGFVTGDAGRWLWASIAVGLWVASVLAVVWSVRRTRRIEAARSQALMGDGQGETVLVAFASQTGSAEELAWITGRALGDAGWRARVVSFAELDLALLQRFRRALFVVSTTGEGDAPDSASRMLRTVIGQTSALPDLSYGLLSLGDRSYRDFCAFGRMLDGGLRGAGARPLFDPVEVDDADPAAIRHWQHHLNQLTGATTAPDWSPPAYQDWRLTERRLLNPGSPGGEAWMLALEPVGHKPDWSAGDIAEVGVPMPGGESGSLSREYSVASLPSEGRVELLVRLMTDTDGVVGLGSGWLTRTAKIGDPVSMRVRTNRGFHGPDAAMPMILIGNGTGLAGLMAHLKARTVGNGGTWLMFGERTAAHDAFHDDALQAMLGDGTLTRLDRTFSRDAGDGRYVQALIADHAAEIVAWVERGAALYVCGSLEGMASAVHATLQSVLGTDTLIALTEAGRYRRDVY